jgi:hypothetical protein
MQKIAVILAVLLMAGCVKTEDEKRLGCLEEAANAPTAAGVNLKKNMCLLEYPVKPGQFVNGAPNPTDPRLSFTVIQKPGQD